MGFNNARNLVASSYTWAKKGNNLEKKIKKELQCCWFSTLSSTDLIFDSTQDARGKLAIFLHKKPKSLSWKVSQTKPQASLHLFIEVCHFWCYSSGLVLENQIIFVRNLT